MHKYNLRSSAAEKHTGEEITYFSNRNCRSVRYFVQGHPHGIWWSYYSNGKLKKIELYYMGEKITEERF